MHGFAERVFARLQWVRRSVTLYEFMLKISLATSTAAVGHA
jgi:hypothetical protein